jgi:biotin carboxylase
MIAPEAVVFMGDMVVVSRQERLLTEAVRRGLAPILVMRTSQDPARLARCQSDPDHSLSLVTEVVWVDDERVETVLAALTPVLLRYRPVAVVSTGEIFVEAVALLADCLGLRGTGSAAARICRNKLFQRLTAPGLAPEWIVVPPGARASVDPDALPFPAVVKPVGRYYSSGVRQVDRPEELPAVLAGYSDDECLLVERRVRGPEFSVEAFVQDHEVFWSGVTAKRTNEHTTRFFTEMGHTSPAPIPDDETHALVEANTDLIRRLGLRDGMTHAEFRLRGKRPVLMEIAARMPGDGITFLWELATGRPVEPTVLDLALGVPTGYPAPVRRASQIFLNHPAGRLVDVTTVGGGLVSWVERDDRWPAIHPASSAEAPPERRAVIVTRHVGDMLGDMPDSTGRCASVIFDVALDVPIEEAEKELTADVSITVATDS